MLQEEARRERMAKCKALTAVARVPHNGKALWQVVNSFGAFALVWGLLYFSLSVGWWLTAPLAVLAGGLYVRIFIILHDCGHRSFFRQRWANELCGFIAGVITFTPSRYWRWRHAMHHATAGNLDRRGVGDVWTMTVAEYMQASRWRRLRYTLMRNPVILLALAPLYLFIVSHRFAVSEARPRERHSVAFTNLGIVLMAAALTSLFGLWNYLLIQLIVVAVGGGCGVWLFYVQHQFEEVDWQREEEWDFVDAALVGSSYYRLPRVLQWFSGNIGFHHLHHLCPAIPNYNLERCHHSDPMFQAVKPLTLRGSLRALSLRFWDESERTLVGFRRIRELRREAAAND